MKKILILYPHFPPSNLAGVHRSRLFAQHLPSYGWKPVILTVHEDYYEEELDHNLEKLLPEDLRIEKVKAFKVTRPRVVGDIGLRAFFQLYKRAKQIIIAEKIDFLFIPIPSFYCALLGRWLHHSTGIRYGIDYIDPWVHVFPGSNKVFSRHWFSTKLAMILEPIAVKKAALITGVAEGYYQGVIDRNKDLFKHTVFGAMPYGGEKNDHLKISDFNIKPYLFEKKKEQLQLIYAGAMLPKAYKPLEAIFKVINETPDIFKKLEIHFIGTGKNSRDLTGYSIRPLAEKYGLWGRNVFEYPARIPYLDVLVHLNASSGIFIIGSTEPHYTPSKVYQGVLSGKPLLAVLHKGCSAVDVICKSGAGLVLEFDGENDLKTITSDFNFLYKQYIHFLNNFDVSSIESDVFETYSAKNVTLELSRLLNKAMEKTV